MKAVVLNLSLDDEKKIADEYELVIGNGYELIERARSIRYEVFTKEQNIATELDHDGLDEESLHVLVSNEGRAIATARLTVGIKQQSSMTRVAVLKAHRSQGIATTVVNALIEHAKTLNIASIHIHAHNYLRQFYEKLGFRFIAEVEVVCGHQLIEMKINLCADS
ncbi:GNAT family N-acetyltransferase [Pseudoalteromonas luteoviolacea]|uniref:GNAT family N-acetyltransferase n=1 Tax=Pseudoalteromonas luteoviolacea TaxID=43657 RepID=UPI00068C045C|nr:GNAT family N-acetyltransferase [Pseudoalteromonas luteoviolacea]